MSRELLERAHTLIVDELYDEAREILVQLQDRSSTARNWLANINKISPLQSETSSESPVKDYLTFRESQPEGDSKVQFDNTNNDGDSHAVSTGEELPIDNTYPVETINVLRGEGRWEYREIVLKTWHQHLSNIEYALEQGGEKITIEDAYTQLLNENGAEGWEIIREEVLPQQYVRLLMKRRVTA